MLNWKERQQDRLKRPFKKDRNTKRQKDIKTRVQDFKNTNRQKKSRTEDCWTKRQKDKRLSLQFVYFVLIESQFSIVRVNYNPRNIVKT